MMTYRLMLATLLAMTCPACGQVRWRSPDGSFRVTWQSDTDGTVPWIEGRVFTASPLLVTNVQVRSEGLVATAV